VKLVDATLGILGPTALRIDGRLEEDWGAPREKALLAVLLVHPGRAVAQDTLIRWVWPEDRAPRNPLPTFHTYATRIRKWLQQLPSPATLRSIRGGFRLDTDRSLIDYHQFRNLVEQAHVHDRAGHSARVIELVGTALSLWRGRFLDDLDTEEAAIWRLRVEQNEWLPANELLLKALIRLGRYDEVLSKLDDLQVDHGENLTLIKLRLSALHGMDRFAVATAYYQHNWNVLRAEADELAVASLRTHYESLFVSSVAGPTSEPSVIPRQLPHDIADFMGRADQLAELDRLIRTGTGRPAGGVVILDGMPGVGKTALAVRWAHRVRHRFPDGDLYVNLNGFSDKSRLTHAAVVDEFLIALGHPPHGGLATRSREQLLSRLVAGREMLVVLDNARDTAQVRDLIPLLSGALVLVTSRQRLTTLSAATGARRVRVEPMTDTEAVGLLSLRLPAQSEPATADHLPVVELCGGLPLVISVLAEHVATRPAAIRREFLAQLDRHQLVHDIGEDGDGSANARTFFSWSYEALPDAERRLFRLLALHPGADISAAAACACDGRTKSETMRSLRALAGAHLLEQPIAFDRYRFHDLIREFAAHCVENDDDPDSRDAARRRILGFYLNSASSAHHLLYPSEPADYENLNEAGVEPTVFDRAEDARQWFGQERLNLTTAIVQAAEWGHHDYAWRLPHTVATYYTRLGFYDDCLTVGNVAVTSAHAVGAYAEEAASQSDLGMLHLVLGDFGNARYNFSAALRFAEMSDHKHGQATVLHQIARLEMRTGNSAACIDLFTRSLAIAIQIEDKHGQCWTHCRLGEALRTIGELDEAAGHLHQARYLAGVTGDEFALANTLNAFGAVHHDQAEHRVAAHYCREALAIAERITDLALAAEVSTTLAHILHDQDERDASVRHAEQAIEIYRRMHDHSGTARALDSLGGMHYDRGEFDDAARAWWPAMELYTQSGHEAHAAGLATKLREIPSAGTKQ
jgi:tetratricopeptide (TPR) repeat protein/DNA-binding SARP family transcriptional activator